jgi:ribosome biogenesis GTPase
VTGRILKAAGGSFLVETASGVINCRARGSLRLDGVAPCPGDIVCLANDLNDEMGMIEKLMPRHNFVPRPPAANLDLLLVVTSVTEPRPNGIILDTMLALARLREIPAAIALTKCDLAEPQPWLDIYRTAGYKVFCLCKTDPDEGDDLPQLLRFLSGKVVLLAGNSGVGKSTLLNRLLPGLDRQTAEISRKLGRGRHTTRQTEFFRAGDMLLGDSPGFSALELVKQGVSRAELAGAFREFEEYIGKCHFPDCAHLQEPGCAIRAAVEDGEIREERYCNYVRFMEVLR